MDRFHAQHAEVSLDDVAPPVTMRQMHNAMFPTTLHFIKTACCVLLGLLLEAFVFNSCVNNQQMVPPSPPLFPCLLLYLYLFRARSRSQSRSRSRSRSRLR